jgi:site-specific DNA recombinase
MAANLISLPDEFYALASPEKVLGDPRGTPAYAYCRSSDRKQAEEGRESLSRQLLVAHERARENGHFIPLELTYWDIWRGKDADRPAFQQLLYDVKENKRSDVIYIDQTDRLSRDRAVYYVLRHDLTRYGLVVHFATEEDELIRHIKLAFDEIELEKRRYRQVQANRARASKGHIVNKFAAFGYDLSDDKLTYVINAEKSVWVQQIFDWYVSGNSIKTITKLLNQFGILSPGGKQIWTPESIRGILRREVYKGTYIANRYERVWVWENGKQRQLGRKKPENEWISFPVPAIVSEEQWNLAQELLEKGRQKALRNSGRREWLLSGLLRCACGKSMLAKTGNRRQTLATGERKTYQTSFYVCWEYYERWSPEHCHRGSIAKGKLENYVLEACERLFMKPDLWVQHVEQPTELIERWQSHVLLCEKQLKEIDAQVVELLQLALEQRSPHIRELFNQKQTELEEQRERYKEQLQIARDRVRAAEDTASQREIIEGHLKQIQELGGIKGLPYDVKRAVLTRLIDEITVDPKEQWFEIKGTLSNKLERFQYTHEGVVVTISAR